MFFLSPIPMGGGLAVASGQVLLSAGCSGPVWRVTHGVFKIEQPAHDGNKLVQLAQAGDLIGVETLSGQPYGFTAIALASAQAQNAGTPCTLDPCAILSQGWMQQQRQCGDMLRLRSGPIAQRLAHLLHMLCKQADGRVWPLQHKELPTLQEMARVVDASPATVRRHLNTGWPEHTPSPMGSAMPWIGRAPLALT